MTTHLWTWSGKDFGDRDGDELWTFDGRHIGHFHGDNVFAADGGYLGELRHDDHLITRLSSLPTRRPCFTPLPVRQARSHYRGFGGFELLPGFKDFPSPESLR